MFAVDFLFRLYSSVSPIPCDVIQEMDSERRRWIECEKERKGTSTHMQRPMNLHHPPPSLLLPPRLPSRTRLQMQPINILRHKLSHITSILQRRNRVMRGVGEGAGDGREAEVGAGPVAFAASALGIRGEVSWGEAWWGREGGDGDEPEVESFRTIFY